jgi:hypothetical protein
VKYRYPTVRLHVQRAPNNPASANRAMTLLFHILRPQRPVAEPVRSAHQVLWLFWYFATLGAMPIGRLCPVRLRVAQSPLVGPYPAKRCSRIGHSVGRSTHRDGLAEPSGSSQQPIAL